MAAKSIFLSHIHEEKDLAAIFKTELEAEFSGFIDVFVSSDGVSIPAGANFLRMIENGLIDCIGALYLISPISVKRNWINFELGAVWIRNAISVREGKTEIPALPLCHSGSLPSTLPAPLNNLNAVTANQSTQLGFAFASLQRAVGGRGKLRTDFDNLANKVINFESVYTRGNHLRDMFIMVCGDGDREALVNFAKSKLSEPTIGAIVGFQPTNIIQSLQSYESKELSGVITILITNQGMGFSETGGVNGARVTIKIDPKIIVEFQNTILGK